MTSRSKSYRMGRDAGEAAASWIFDGNTETETYRRVLDGYNEGDPEIMEMEGSPLSGEWGGESIPEIFGRWPSDREMELYEEGYSNGFWDEILRVCRYHLGMASLSVSDR